MLPRYKQRLLLYSHILYFQYQGCLTIVSQADHSEKKASLLQDMHYRNISQRLVLLKRSRRPTVHLQFFIFSFRTEEAAKYLEATKLQTSNGYSEEFTVMEDLMGLAIGYKSTPDDSITLKFRLQELTEPTSNRRGRLKEYSTLSCWRTPAPSRLLASQRRPWPRLDLC